MNSTNFKQHFYLPLSRLGSHNSGLPIFSFGNSCLRARPSRVSLWGAGTVKQSDVNAMVNLFTELVATALVILSTLRSYQELPLFSFLKNVCLSCSLVSLVSHTARFLPSIVSLLFKVSGFN